MAVCKFPVAGVLLAVFFCSAVSIAAEKGPAGEGKTLPKDVLRFRTLIRSATSSQGFSSDGKKAETGFRLNASAGALVIEYGYTSAISFQLVAPFVFRNQMSMDGSVFQKSFVFKEKYDQFLSEAVKKLVSDGLCSDSTVCLESIQSKGLSLPATTDLILPTGEKLTVRAGVPLKEVATSLVTRAALPAEGRTGLGDIEIGALIALADPQSGLWKKDWPLNFSVGLGLRSPTGSFSDVPAAQRGTGRGTVDLGLRTNFDWHAASGLVMSFQNQWEQMVVSGSKRRWSLLDSSELNKADPMAAGAEQVANNAKFERSGSRQVGFLKLAAGAGEIFSSLEPVVFSLQWKYDFEPKTLRGGRLDTAESELQSALAGVQLDGLKMNLPVQFDLEYELPFAGKNRPLAAQSMSAILKAYARF
jgi:hypothetical protein